MKKHEALTLGAAVSRLIGLLLDHWKLALVIVFFVSPIGPHLRVEYTYRDAYGQRVYLGCTYLGSRGFITPDTVPECPFFAFLDAREAR